MEAQLIQVLRSAARLQFLVSSRKRGLHLQVGLQPAALSKLYCAVGAGHRAADNPQAAIIAVLAKRQGQLDIHQQLCLYSMQVTIFDQHDSWDMRAESPPGSQRVQLCKETRE